MSAADWAEAAGGCFLLVAAVLMAWLIRKLNAEVEQWRKQCTDWKEMADLWHIAADLHRDDAAGEPVTDQRIARLDEAIVRAEQLKR